MTIYYQNKRVGLDDEGYLLDPEQWDNDVAVALADTIAVDMTEQHWEIVHMVRNHFEDHQSVPELRRVLQKLRQIHGKEIATRKYVYNLFPYGFGQQACKIAGMRKPLKLILDL